MRGSFLGQKFEADINAAMFWTEGAPKVLLRFEWDSGPIGPGLSDWGPLDFDRPQGWIPCVLWLPQTRVPWAIRHPCTSLSSVKLVWAFTHWNWWLVAGWTAYSISKSQRFCSMSSRCLVSIIRSSVCHFHVLFWNNFFPNRRRGPIGIYVVVWMWHHTYVMGLPGPEGSNFQFRIHDN